jgi:16S rRNA (guanine966-N2)-methyltransferase
MPVVPGSRCLDAFTGSGALGFEALSRQAKEVVMLEPDQLAYRHLIDNAQNLNATGCKIFGTRAEQWLAIPATEPFDIVFIDPPFALELWSIVLEVLEANNWLAENAWIYVETPKTYSLMAPQNWRLHRTKQAGNVTFSLYQRDFSSDS